MVEGLAGWQRPKGTRRRFTKIGEATAAAEHADGGGCSGQNRSVTSLTGRILAGSEVPVGGKGLASILEVRGTHSTFKLGGCFYLLKYRSNHNGLGAN
jgi:hypothetical protein